MQKLLGVLLGCLLSVGSSAVYSTPVTLQVDMNISTAWDYVNSQYVTIPQLSGSFNFTFDDAGVPRVCVAPSSCPNQTEFPDGLSAASTLTALIPSSYSDGLGTPSVYFAPDYSSSYSGLYGAFDWANAGTTTFNSASGEYFTHVIYLTIVGLNQNAPTYGSAIDFLLAALNTPDKFKVIVGEAWYASLLEHPTMGTFTEGFDWRDNDAELVSINGQHSINPRSKVPEPSSILLSLAAGLGMVGAMHCKMKAKRQTA